MRTISITDKICEISGDLPCDQWFETIGNVTALRWNPHDGFYRSNFARGPLLYSLIARYRPSAVLEIGTGRGYGTVCMARALVDHNIDGQIITIDVQGVDDPQFCPINRGEGALIEELTINEIWGEYCDPRWRERITCLTGSSSRVISEWPSKRLPNPDFGFIDAGHRYAEVRYDFYAFLSIASPRSAVLLDDYIEAHGFGVKRLVDTDIASAYHTELIETSWRPRNDSAPVKRLSGMVLIDTRVARCDGAEILTPELIDRRLIDAQRQRRLLEIKDRLKSALYPLLLLYRKLMHCAP